MIQVEYNDRRKEGTVKINVVVKNKAELQTLYGFTTNFLKLWVKKVELDETLEPGKKYVKLNDGKFITLKEYLNK